MENALGNAFLVMIVVRVLWDLVVPTIIIIAACKLWNSAPRWIPSVFLATALVSVIASAPPSLMLIHQLTVEQYGRIGIPIAAAQGITRLLFAVALLALAVRMKRMTEPAAGAAGRPPAQP